MRIRILLIYLFFLRHTCSNWLFRFVLQELNGTDSKRPWPLYSVNSTDGRNTKVQRIRMTISTPTNPKTCSATWVIQCYYLICYFIICYFTICYFIICYFIICCFIKCYFEIFCFPICSKQFDPKTIVDVSTLEIVY